MQKKRVAVIAKRSNLQLATLRKADGWRLPRRFAPRNDALLSGHHAIASPCLWAGGGSNMKFLDGFGEKAYALLRIVAGLLFLSHGVQNVFSFALRSAKRWVGKECVRTCKSWWSSHY